MTMTMKIITQRLLFLTYILLLSTAGNVAKDSDPKIPPATINPQPATDKSIMTTGLTTEIGTRPPTTPESSTVATSSHTTTSTAITSTTTSTPPLMSTTQTKSTTVTSQPSSTSPQPSTATTGSTVVQTTQSTSSRSATTGSTPSVSSTTTTGPTPSVSSTTTTGPTPGVTSTTTTGSTPGVTSTTTTGPTPSVTSTTTTGSTPGVTSNTSSTPNVTDTTTNSSNTTAINPGGGLNSSEMALTVVLGIVLGVVALAIIVYTLRKRRQRMLPFTHQRLYCRDDTVDLFAPPDDTLVISGGLYDGTQMNPVDGDVTMDHTFSGQPAPLRLEFLNDGTERTPNQASTFATFPSQWS
ncbi:uncharacterized protein LOC143104421 [Alosa pseudoharengus]|uniref:uncharacterized protein LOC143104421 n=1 Tax=Alosa pseudoharengus TaxID=34774 RepID=UPI003F89307E